MSNFEFFDFNDYKKKTKKKTCLKIFLEILC